MNCPKCQSESYNGLKCQICGYEKPPEYDFIPSPNAKTIGNEDAKTFGPTLQSIIDTEGGITPPRVVTEARKKSSPLHNWKGWLGWNEKVASEQYWKNQARQMLRGISVVVKFADGNKTVRAFYSVSDETESEKRVYIGVQRAFSTERTREEIIHYAKTQIKIWAEKYRQYDEFSGIVRQIDTFFSETGSDLEADSGERSQDHGDWDESPRYEKIQRKSGKKDRREAAAQSSDSTGG